MKARIDPIVLSVLVRGEIARLLLSYPYKFMPLRQYTRLSEDDKREIWGVRTGPADLDLAITPAGEAALASLRLPVQGAALTVERAGGVKTDLENLADGSSRKRLRRKVAGLGRAVVFAGPLGDPPVNPMPEQAYALLADVDRWGKKVLDKLEADPPLWTKG